MDGMLVDKYFVFTDKGLKPSDIIGDPVYESNSSVAPIGKIISYNKKNGLIKIELSEKTDYKNLIKVGIPLNHIIFNNS